MISIVNKRVIYKKTPEELFRFFVYLNKKKFQKFHAAHLYYKLTKRDPRVVGSEYIFEHLIDGKRLRHKWKVYSAKPYEYIFSQAKGILPIKLKLSFKKVKGGTEVLHEIHAGFKKWGIEKFVDWLAKKTIFPQSQINALMVHSQEELLNLQKVA